MSIPPHPRFPTIRFTGRLRPSQSDVVEIARRQLATNQRSLHVVAPPGSGKTVLGLYLWAECIRAPALVLSPNSAIQAQWADRLDLFDCPHESPDISSTDPNQPALFTSLTYQSVTLPRRGNPADDRDALELWIESLVEKGEAEDPGEAQVWIDDLRRHNRDYYEERLAGYRKTLRDQLASGGQALQTLHRSSRATLDRLKSAGLGLIIFDECHHLLSHWGRVLADAHTYFGEPIIIGLTATPPETDGKPSADVERYRSFFGPVDYEVPVPAVVKDGFLAPYQDLVQFVRPTPDELSFVANADHELAALVESLCAAPQTRPTNATPDSPAESPRESLTDWLSRVLKERRHAVGTADDWATFERRDPDLAWAGPRFLKLRGIALPEGVPVPRAGEVLSSPSRLSTSLPPMAVLIPVLDRYIRRRLRKSALPADHELAEQTIARLRILGTQITETGSQACASPISRVLAYARGKAQAVVPILKAESAALGEQIRAVIVTDFEKTSAVTAETSHLLDAHAGGAIAVYRELLRDPATDRLDPILVTGSTVLVDDDLAQRFDHAATDWLTQRGIDVELQFGQEDGFHIVSGKGADWSPRNYVAMVTELFQRGVTRCLVGTRGLLGEGWDATRINVLIDLTTVTTSTSVNQLRGRSIRLDPDDPQKLAHNWDVVCIAPEFVKGLDDYQRFIRKHNTIYGVTDDGLVEKGVGHVHAALTEIEPELVEESMALLNEAMLARPARRAHFRALWRIGEPFHAEAIHTLEIAPPTQAAMAPPPYGIPVVEWSSESLTQAIGRAVLGGLQETKAVSGNAQFRIEKRAGGYLRAFLRDASEEDSRLFSDSLAEALAPLDRPRYVIRRFVDYRITNWLSRLLPEVVGRYFEKSLSRMEMLHTVPSRLARSRKLADIYARHWNEHVSPGQPVYARSEEGRKLIDKALFEQTTPTTRIHRKQAFV